MEEQMAGEEKELEERLKLELSIFAAGNQELIGSSNVEALNKDLWYAVAWLYISCLACSLAMCI